MDEGLMKSVAYALVLRARDAHGYDWNAAVTYADGHHAARAGWNARFFGAERAADIDRRRRAYEHGFRDGGGEPDDIFDAARRTFAAAGRTPVAHVLPTPPASRPLPSHWPIPSDQPAPTSWHRRLLIVGRAEMETGATGILDMLKTAPGHDAVMLIVADPDLGLRALDVSTGCSRPLDGDRILGQAGIDDILVAADGNDLACVDGHAHCLPIVRNMERTRNSVLQQRAQFRIWLARGRAPGTLFAAGHIRWGKVAAGLTGRLGEFTARYAGPAEPRGHRIVIEDASGKQAHGYRSAAGQPLEPEVVISNRAHLRASMTMHLRSFAAGLRF